MEPFYFRQDLLKMLQKYLNGEATSKEVAFVEAYYKHLGENPQVLNQYAEDEREALSHEMEAYLLDRVRSQTRIVPMWRKSWFKIGVAASVLLCVALLAGNYFKREQTMVAKQQEAPTDFLPGGDKAVLTLSDGSTIILDSTQRGNLENIDRVAINKSEEGQLVYERSGANFEYERGGELNTVTTPAGGQYRVVLPDGSKVWLNAQSSIQFPTTFLGHKRKVKITGECYFEVFEDKRRPFVVDVVGKEEVVVLGTHFNINAYRDESEIKTTLLEGSVQVKSTGLLSAQKRTQTVTLRPGEQAAMTKMGRFNIGTPNNQEVMAWKNGFFQFQKANLETVMRQISRWYNVEVVYEKEIPAKTFSGKIDRSANASQILEILHFAGVNFRMEASDQPGTKGTIVVTP